MEEEKITLNPDGKVFYLEQHNPYTKLVDSENQIYTNALELQGYSRFIRAVAIIDIIFNIGLDFPYYLITSLMSLCGYFGALRYDNVCLIFYMIFEIIKIIGKSIILYYNFKNQALFVYVAFSEMYDIYVLYVTKKLTNLINAPFS